MSSPKKPNPYAWFSAKKIPTDPGCYLFLDKEGTVLYVGKAKNLRARVRTYFQKNKKSPKTASLLKKVAAVETRIVSSEAEALILENNLIKDLQPRYNILLRDDKNFLYLRITDEPFPRMEITRRIVRDGSFYLGPRTSAKKFRSTIAFCQKIFQIRTCRLEMEPPPCPSPEGGGKKGEGEYQVPRDILEKARNLRKNQTRLEEIMWTVLRNRNFCGLKFRRQHPVGNFILDFYCLEKKIAVEIDGSQHEEAENKKRDERRTRFLNAQGIRVLRFSNADVFTNLEGVLQTLYEEIFSPSPQPSPGGSEGSEAGPTISKNPEKRKIPCLDFHIKKCSGPCDGKISREEYRADVTRMKRFLRGDTREVLRFLQEKMMRLAQEKKFEAAAKMRDLIASVESSTERQRVQFTDTTSRDFLHFVRKKNSAFFIRLAFREGKLLDQNEIEFRAEAFESDEAVIEQFLLQFYDRVDEMPAEIFLPAMPESQDSLESVLSTKLNVPLRGEKKKVLQLARKNAETFAEQKEVEALSQAENFADALPTLAGALSLPEPPRRIECFDISHFGGTATVASQVVFLDGEPKKSQYRRFHLKSLPAGKIDDFAAMEEVLSRRFARTEDPKFAETLPDLIVLDGGKGQLSSVLKIFKTLSVPGFDPKKQICALAKREEEVFVPGKKEPVELAKDAAASKLLQRLRDEAHRFAISFSRSVRQKSAKKSALDSIRGIGPATKKKLLQECGSVAGIRKASDKKLSGILNAKQLQNLRKQL